MDARIDEGGKPCEENVFEIAGVHAPFVRDVVKRLIPYLYQVHIKIGREWWSNNVVVRITKRGGETPASFECESVRKLKEPRPVAERIEL